MIIVMSSYRQRAMGLRFSRMFLKARSSKICFPFISQLFIFIEDWGAYFVHAHTSITYHLRANICFK
nr:hypothetical protein PsAHV6-051 [Psittacid alphaherpesvirus 6]